MDVAYDAVQKESYPQDRPTGPPTPDPSAPESSVQRPPSSSVSSDFRDAYKDFSGSAWGTKLGGWWNTAKTQGQSYYEAAQKELSSASSEARGAADLTGSTAIARSEVDEAGAATPRDAAATAKQPDRGEVPENLGADIVKEATSLLSGFQLMAGERLKRVQAAEDAADEALVKFGTNLRNYLQDAVKITAPEDSKDGSVKSVLFESKDQDGRRVVHATRFDAQMHVIHANLDSFSKDPDSPGFPPFRAGFDAEKDTDRIAGDLAKYAELRRSMEKLVPEKVEYGTFWARYYFLRHVVEEQEQKRRELLKEAGEEEEVKWDDDEDEESLQKAPTTPKVGPAIDEEKGSETPRTKETERKNSDLLRPGEGRRSNEMSVADSEASYDIVSTGTSRGPGSPREAKKAEQSDDEDWE